MPKLAQEIGHRRIGRGVRAGHVKAALLEHSGQRGHRRSADADQVNMFFVIHACYSNQTYFSTKDHGADR